MAPILMILKGFARSATRQALWWAGFGILMAFVSKSPLMFRVLPALVSIGLLACLPRLYRNEETDLRPSVTQYVLQLMQQTLLILSMTWTWRGTPASWFVYIGTALIIPYGMFECYRVIQTQREVRARGLEVVARDRVHALMLKDPHDPFSKVREYCFEVHKRTDVERDLADAISDRMEYLFCRMKEYQRTPNG